MSRVTEQDRLFAELVVSQGIASRALVEECVAELERLTGPKPTLGEYLVRRGVLSSAKMQETLRPSGTPAVAPPLPDDLRIGKYALEAKLGEGGMGVVWKARDELLGRPVALKFLKGGDDQELARFTREAQTAAKLNHPNIAAVYEVGEHQSRPFIAMQFVDGRTITARGTSRRRLVELVRDFARAVAYANGQGVVHRDIKPGNLMVAADGRAYVMDFGLAKSMHVQSSLSASGAMIGTPAYMSPEQARGQLAVDGRSDVWSLGATLYDLLAGRPPFKGTDPYEVLQRVIDSDPGRLRGVDRDLETIVLKCLEKEPERRYATADALADDLGRWLAGEAIEARPASVWYRLRKRLAKRSAAVIVGSIGLSAVMIVAALLVPRWREARRAADAETLAREQTQLFLETEKELELLRMRFYQPDFRLTEEEIARYERLVDELIGHMDRQGPSAQGWHLIGRCREAAFATDAAFAAYDQALKIAPDHTATQVRLGRLLLERGLLQALLFERDARDAQWALREAMRGRDLLRRASGRRDTMDVDLAEGYVQVIERRGTAWEYDAELMLRKWPGQPFVEEFLILQSLARGVALQPLDEAIRRMPAYAQAWFIRGQAARFRNDAASALRDVTRAIEIHPRFAIAYHARSRLRLDARDHAGAIADTTEALRWMPRFDLAWMHRGIARLQSGDAQGAIEDCTRALEISPDLPEAYNNRACAYERLGDWQAALRDYGRALEIDPSFGPCYVNRGNLLQRRGDFDGALSQYDLALEKDPSCAPAWGARCGVLLKRGRLGEALDAIERALALAPKSGLARAQRAHVLRGLGRTDEAWADAEQAVRLDPQSPDAWYQHGLILRDRGDARRALEDFTRAVGLAPDFAPIFNDRGLVRRTLGDLAGAIQDFDRSIALDDTFVEAYVNRGMARAWRGEHAAAIPDYEKALSLRPSFASALENRGASRRQLGDLRGALSDLDRAIELDPKAASAWANRALTHAALGDAGRALADYSTCVEVDPRLADAWYNRALLRAKRGDREGAILDCEKALEVADPGWPHRDRVQQALEQFRR